MTIATDRARLDVPVALPKFPAELRLVVAAARMIGNGGDPAQLALAARGSEWPVAVQGLVRHGLIGLAGPALLRADHVPDEIAAKITAEGRNHAVSALARISEVAMLAQAFEAAGIRYLLVKGVALSVQLYGDPALRGGRDIDILIERSRTTDAQAILRAAGYAIPANALPDSAAGDAPPKESAWVNRKRRMLVEVHDRLTDNLSLLPWEFEQLWQDREMVMLAGRSLPTIGRARLPVYLAVHGIRHGWERLMWLEDLAGLLQTGEDFDHAIAGATDLGLDGMMLHVGWALHHWLARPVPGDLIARARRRLDTRLLNRLVAQFHGGAHWHEYTPAGSLHRFLTGSVWGRLISYVIKPNARYWRREIARELDSPHDRALFQLPPGLRWAYPLLRPFGWAIRRLRGS